MGKRVKVAFSLVTTSDQSTGSATGAFDMSDSGAGDIDEIVKQNEEDSLATTGLVGAAFVSIDVPKVIKRIAIRPLAGQEIAIRLNGAPAKVQGTAPSFGTIINGDTFPLTVDGGTLATVTFTATDITGALVVARINAAAGAIVASLDASNYIVLTGAKTGGQLAQTNLWQNGSIVVGAGTALTKLGLVAGTTYGSALADLHTTNRFYLEPPTSGAGAITKIELSGSGKFMSHVSGQPS